MARRILFAALALGAVALVWAMLRPTPVLVELAKATRGPMRTTVDEDGETRARNRFVIAAPIPGRMLRVELEDGDAVRENQIVALIEPLPLNQLQREEVLARVETAEASKRQADARAAHAEEDYTQSHRDLARAELLFNEKVISTQALEQARNTESTSASELAAAKFGALAAAAGVKVARSGLIGMRDGSSAQPVVSLRSPIAGRVLRVVEKSERVLQSGAPLVILGDPRKIEIVTDVLTTDAVNIRPGVPAFLEGWGGDHPLRAKVRLVEPAGFAKVSALGVEEKRVNVIADFVDPPDGLGDGYRVETRIVTWSADDVLKIPGSATFRDRDGWSVFVVENGRARRRAVQVGHRNQLEAEILGGINDGEEVVLRPSNQLGEGVRVRTQ
ncbi:MAG TPA: efflux RND transporter periplasmic adaptor subunit [Candidatus Acidoferrales bacterium]|nr:efflux RND transporter periplasmic adaptor subunit [Candidatus Acidoferrales bacterium]